MSLSIVRIADGSAFMVAAWVVSRKRAEVIWANLLDRAEAGVVIIGDAGCIGIIGKL
jgi:5-keto 4-deoxyuronate isomerase